jgi:hypothetical protein
MNRTVGLLGSLLLVITSTANAAVSDEEFREVKDLLQQALARIERLEAGNARTNATVAELAESNFATAVAVATLADSNEQTTLVVAQIAEDKQSVSWPERIRWQGDFRYRWQNDEIKQRLDSSNQPLEDQTRDRQRIRARAALIADLTDTIEVGIGLATGGDDPVSSNQTLGGSGSSKDLKLDLAYFDWTFLENGNLAAGKFKNPFYRPGKNGLMWDRDWRPEGFALRWKSERIYLQAMGTWLESDTGNSASSFSYGGQFGFKPAFGNTRLNLGAGYWLINSEGEDCFDAPGNTGGNGANRGCFGNTAVDGSGTLVAGGTPALYIMDYAPVEFYAQAEFGTRFPWSLFADYVVNIDAKAVPTGPSQGKKLDTGYAFGASVGRDKNARDWLLKLIYQDLDADAVLGLLSESDFAGGGTDSKGWVLRGRYMLTDRTNFTLRYFRTERKDSNGVENGSSATSNPFDVNTLQLDLNFKYR